MAYCEKCGAVVPEDEIRDVLVARMTRSSPAEYEEWCVTCCCIDRDADYERANQRYKESHGGRAR